MMVVARRIVVIVLLVAIGAAARADDWQQWIGPKRDSIWRESGIIEKLPSGGPKVRWKIPVGQGYSGPAVAGGKVIVTDRVLADGQTNPASGFSKDKTKGKERILCVDAATGKELWRHAYNSTYQVGYAAGPRATPVIDGELVFALGAMGDLLCLDLASGKVHWSKNLPNDFETRVPVWGFAAHPLVDGDKLICIGGGKDGLAIALDKKTGKELWHAVPGVEIGYCPPMIYDAGGKRQLIIWHPAGVASLDPETGKEYWKEPWKLHNSSMSISTPRYENGMLFFTSFYNGSMMLKLAADTPKAEVLWKGKWWKGGTGAEQPDKTEGMHSIMGTPFFEDGHIYGVCSYGEFRCIKADNGERLWMTYEPTSGKSERWGNTFFVKQGDRFFFFSEKGDLIIAKLSPKGYEELSRSHVIDPLNTMAGRKVVWMHPAFANQAMYARNDAELICVGLSQEENRDR